MTPRPASDSFWNRPESRRWAAAILACAVMAAYAGTFGAPFELDDQGSILENPTIRHLWPPWAAFSPPRDAGGITVNGRPLLNFSLALNYAISGTGVWSYHLFNLIIHTCAGLTLFGVVRRTLALMKNANAQSVAFAVALLWSLHPLQTESVTYVIQRAESLVSLFYLLTFYCYLRGAAGDDGANAKGSNPGTRCYALSVVACVLGMATKEVMVSAPLMVLLHDRTFAAGSFAVALRKRRGLYAGLFGSWVLLGILVLSAAGRGGTAAGAVEMTAWSYALTQCRAIMLYLRLAIWPAPLVFDYGTGVVSGLGAVAWQAVAIVGLLGATVLALRRRPAVGFLGVFFFAVLAPSSSLVPVATQTIAEHRMYLPLAALAVLATTGIRAIAGKSALRICAGLAVVLGVLTVFRNRDYRGEMTLWQDTVAKFPSSARAQNNLGALLALESRNAEAIVHYKAALAIRPDYLRALGNLAQLQIKEGEVAAGLATYAEVLRVHPDFDGHLAFARMLEQTGNRTEAISHLEAALALQPDSSDAHLRLANLLMKSDRTADALSHYRTALKLKPEDATAHSSLGAALALAGQPDAALAEFNEALRRDPKLVNAHVGLALILESQGRTLEAAQERASAASIGAQRTAPAP